MATYALIPGGGGDPWEWHRLVPELEARGHHAIAVRLPSEDDGAGWSEYADTVIDVLGGRSEVVVVAESLGGFTAPIVCARRPVDLLVLLNAMIPLPGETGNAWWSNTGSGEAMRAYHASIGLSSEAADDDSVLYYHDLPAELAAEALARTWQDQSVTPMEQPWPLDAWPDVPTRLLAGRHDRLFPLEFQRRVARERLGLDVDEIDGGHMVAMSKPGELADRLESYRTALQTTHTLGHSRSTGGVTIEANKDLVRRFVREVFVDGRREAVDELLADGFVSHTWASSGDGKADLKQAIERVRVGLGEIAFTIEDVIAEDDRVAVRMTAHARQIGEFMGRPPTGRSYTIGEIHIFRIEGGRLAEHWHQYDALGMLRQLGVLPSG